MKKTLITLSVGLALSNVANAEVLITEYVEGGSYNKAIELYNNGSESVLLSNYTLARYKDGSEIPTQMLNLTGTLAPQELLVVQNSLAELSLSADVATIISSALVHNGGDAVALLNDGNVVDIVGDVPTTSGWGKDITLRRIGRSASTVFDESDWSSYAKDTFDGLGSLSDEGVDNTIPDATATTIMEIQGDAWSSPLIESGYESEGYYEVTGIVTAIQTSALGNDLPVGFFLQDQYGDGNENTSDAIFIRGDISGIKVGNTVTVQGKAYESYGWTQLIDTHVNNVEPTQTTITPTPLRTLDTDDSFNFTLERHEGMLVELDEAADMHITRTFSFDYDAYRYNMMASYERVNLHMNQQNVAGSVEAAAKDNENKDRRIYIESFQKAANGVVPWYSDFLKESAVQWKTVQQPVMTISASTTLLTDFRAYWGTHTVISVCTLPMKQRKTRLFTIMTVPRRRILSMGTCASRLSTYLTTLTHHLAGLKTHMVTTVVRKQSMSLNVRVIKLPKPSSRWMRISLV